MGARVIMVASGKGGTGKSTVAVMTGAALGARGRRVLLVELDSALRSVDYIAGVYGKTVYDVEAVSYTHLGISVRRWRWQGLLQTR